MPTFLAFPVKSPLGERAPRRPLLPRPRTLPGVTSVRRHRQDTAATPTCHQRRFRRRRCLSYLSDRSSRSAVSMRSLFPRFPSLPCSRLLGIFVAVARRVSGVVPPCAIVDRVVSGDHKGAAPPGYGTRVGYASNATDAVACPALPRRRLPLPRAVSHARAGFSRSNLTMGQCWPRGPSVSGLGAGSVCT